MRTKLLVVFVVGLIGIGNVASAAIDTETTGDVCGNGCPDHSFGTFSAQTYKGATRPSEGDQIIKFYFKRKGTSKWHRFGRKDPNGTSPAFKSIEGHGLGHAHIKDDGTWRFRFSAYQEGRWVLMAKFHRQDGYAASAVRRHVVVHSSE